MSRCISNQTSQNFISRQLRTRNHLNIIEMTEEYFIRYDLPLHGIYQIALSMVKRIRTETRFPLFLPINTVCDSRGTKHSQLIIITKTGGVFGLLFFDPNGLLISYTKDGKTEQTDTKGFEFHYLISYLLNVMIKHLFHQEEKTQSSSVIKRTRSSHVKSQSEFWTDLSVFQLNNVSLNPYGHCDAIVLWFIYLNRESETIHDFKKICMELETFLGYDTKKNLNPKKMLTNTIYINEQIKLMASLRKK